jgi:uncharacterized protein with GYD domain
MKFTEQGIKNVKDTVSRSKSLTEAFEAKYGIKVLGLYWTLGQYDLVAVTDVPDEKTGTASALALGMMGNVTTQTLRAYTAEEMTEFISLLP